MEILRIYPEERPLTKHYAIKHLTLLKIQNLEDTKEVLLQWFINFLIRTLPVVLLHMLGPRPQLREI